MLVDLVAQTAVAVVQAGTAAEVAHTAVAAVESHPAAAGSHPAVGPILAAAAADTVAAGIHPAADPTLAVVAGSHPVAAPTTFTEDWHWRSGQKVESSACWILCCLQSEIRMIHTSILHNHTVPQFLPYAQAIH